ncbi:APC family permease [Paenibacillus turpanensis]|uniref:APC family permease n=1 Tax=Paenibacillus turpanensis TaxID=2689078 RepID=UPI00140DC464|nr:amino acid permease [Paenibacillus turpanensis]
MSSRSITYVQGVALYMGAVLGSGILILPGNTAELAGPASIISWVLMSLLSIPLAYTFARLALAYEHYGGVATIVGQAYGRTWSAIVGWLFFVWVCCGQAVVGLTGAGYISAVFGLPEAATYGFAWLFLVAAAVTNWLGMRASAAFSLVLSGTVLVLLLLTIGFSLPDVRAEHFTPFAPGGISGIGQACVLIFWAFFGWESITHLVPEFRRPQRDVMRATWSSVFLIGAVYTLLSVVTVGTGGYGADGTNAPLAALMSRAIGVSAGFATAIVACIVCAGTLNVYLASSSRLCYAMAEERKLPRWFLQRNKQGTPQRGVLFFFVTNTLTLAASLLFKIPVEELILVPTSLGIFVYIIASFACVKLLWKDRIGRVSALLAAVCCTAVAPFSYGYLVCPIVVAAVCVVYLRWREASDGVQLEKTGIEG